MDAIMEKEFHELKNKVDASLSELIASENDAIDLFNNNV